MIILDLTTSTLNLSSDLNQGFLGYNVSEINKMACNDFREILHPHDHQIAAVALKYFSRDGRLKEISFVKRIKDKAGKYRLVKCDYSVNEKKPDGEVVKLKIEAEDITKEQQLNVELHNAKRTIDHLQFINSHQLRSPVTTIIGLVNIIRGSMPESGGTRELLGHLEVAAQKLDDIVLNINKVGEGHNQ